ncbi:MAG: GLUG motif-containing protein [Paludibacter sp.]
MKTSFYPLLIVVVLLLCNPTRNMAQQNVSKSPAIQIFYSGGSGTVGDPYHIANLTDLRYLSEHSGDWSKYFEQTADIDATATNTWNVGNHDNDAGTATVAMGFSPIGNSTTNFSGKYDGLNHTISGLYINRPKLDYIGLFGYISYDIRNLGLLNISYIGQQYVGGLVGCANSGTILNTFSKGTVAGYSLVGGLVGWTYLACTISDSYSEVNVSGTNDFTAGLVGINWGTITKCYAKGNVSGPGSWLGGLVGDNGGVPNGGIIRESYATGNVNGSTTAGANFGGLVARNNNGTINNSYSTGNVTGYDNVGGLVGYIHLSTSSISNSYATGTVTTPTFNRGGLIGANYFGATLTNCYWDTQTSGIAISGSGGTGKTTAEMKTQATFTNWDFVTTPVWKITTSKNNGYPYLAWQVYPPFSGGAGTLANPYQIATLADLRFLSENTSYWAAGKYFTQTADIDATASNTWNSNGSGGYYGFSPIGNLTTNFLGSYDGQGHSISNLYINRPITDYNSIFGYIFNATIINLGLTNVNITGNKRTGGLIGQASGLCTVTSCYTTGSVTGIADQAAGLIGKKDCAGTVSNCYSKCNITCHDNGGGLIAACWNGAVEKSYATGNVSVTNSIVGGLVGEMYNSIASTPITLTNCYAKGNVNGTNNTGGFVGHAYAGTIAINKCYSNGIVTGNIASFANGFVGNLQTGTVTSCFFDAENDGLTNSTAGTNYNGAIGKTTAEMKAQTTFSNWDFVTAPDWKIASTKNNGNPYLAWQNLPIDVPAVQASALVFTQIHNYDMTISWTIGNGESRAVFVKEGAGAITNPTDNSTYIANSDWASRGTQLATSGYYCVYKGTGNSVNVTNLSKNTEYSVQLFEFNGASGSEVYNTSTGVDNPKNQTTANESGTSYDVKNAIRLKIYPNPATEVFHLEGLSGVSSIYITDLGGRLVLEKRVLDNENIQITALPKGVYIVKIVTNNEKKELKLVKSN